MNIKCKRPYVVVAAVTNTTLRAPTRKSNTTKVIIAKS